MACCAAIGIGKMTCPVDFVGVDILNKCSASSTDGQVISDWDEVGQKWLLIAFELECGFREYFELGINSKQDGYCLPIRCNSPPEDWLQVGL